MLSKSENQNIFNIKGPIHIKKIDFCDLLRKKKHAGLKQHESKYCR